MLTSYKMVIQLTSTCNFNLEEYGRMDRLTYIHTCRSFNYQLFFHCKLEIYIQYSLPSLDIPCHGIYVENTNCTAPSVKK